MSKKNSFDVSVRAISAVVEKFQQQREIANKQVIYDLDSVFSALSPKGKDQADVMAESDQRQKLVDKTNSTNITISVFKKDVDNLKRSIKRQSRHQNNKSKEIQECECQERKHCWNTLSGIVQTCGGIIEFIIQWCNTLNNNKTSGTKKYKNDSDESSVELKETEYESIECN